MVQVVGQRPRRTLHGAEIPHPGVLRELAFEFDDDIVVVAVERFAGAPEGGHVGGSESETVAFDGDSAGGRHGSILAEAE